MRADLRKPVGRGAPSFIPAILLARLALDRSLHGRALGGELLWDALSRAVQASNVAAARRVVVDAIDEGAAGFYRGTTGSSPSRATVADSSNAGAAS